MTPATIGSPSGRAAIAFTHPPSDPFGSSGDHDPPVSRAAPRAVVEPTFVNAPPTSQPPPGTAAIARTSSLQPVPMRCHAVPSNRATWPTPRPATVLNGPPATTPPGTAATVMTAVLAPPFHVVHVEPSHRATLQGD